MIAFALAVLVQQSPDPAAYRPRLVDDDPEVREAAVDELVRLGKPALKAVRLLREDRDAEVRGRAERAFQEIAAGLRAKALKLEVTLEAAKVRAGTAPRFTARLVNVEEIPVEVLRPAPLQSWQSPQWSGQRQGRWAGWNYVEECLQPTALGPGEGIDVTAEVSMTLKQGQVWAWECLPKGKHTLVFSWRPADAAQMEDLLSSRVQIEVQQRAAPRQKEEAAPAAAAGAVTAELQIEVVE